MFTRFVFFLACCITAPLEMANAASAAHIVMMIGEDEYHTWETLPAFAAAELHRSGYRVTIIHADATEKQSFPGLVAALRDADLLFVSVRRRLPPKEQLDAVRAHLIAGKSLIGIRTACHAFAPLPNIKTIAPGHSIWQDFDAEVLGAHYTGHHRGTDTTAIALAPRAARNPIVRDIVVEKLIGHAPLYKVSPLAVDVTPLLIGTFGVMPPEPVAWTRLYGPKHARVFFTSLGAPEDFASTEFRHLLVNAVRWTVDR